MIYNMDATLNHLKKGESLSDKQLIVINSSNRDVSTQNSSSFTYTFNEPLDRVSRADVMYAKIPKTFYNVNNDNASMSITTQTFTETVEETLVVDDDEIDNGIINATNVEDTSVSQTSLYDATTTRINDITVQNTFLYTAGSFAGGILDLYNSTDVSASVVSNTGTEDLFVAKYTLDQLLQWRFRISGLQSTILSKIQTTDTAIYVSGVFNSFPVKFYNSDDTTNPANDLLSDGDYTGFIARYDTDGNFVWALRIIGITTTKPMYISDITNGFLYVCGTYENNLSFYNTSDILTDTLPIGSNPLNTFIARYDLDGGLDWRANINGGCSTTHCMLNTNGNIMTAVDFTGTLQPFNSSDVNAPANDLTNDGQTNICIIEYDSLGEIVDRFKIGGSSSDNFAKISVSGAIYISGSYTSNPVKFYNTSDTYSLTQPNISNNSNLFVVQYDLATKTPQWSVYIESSGSVSNRFISASLNNTIYITGVYDALTKFNDITGDILGQDLAGATTTRAFIVKYDTSGNFVNRAYLTSSTTGNIEFGSLDATSNSVYASATFVGGAVNLHSADNSISKTITNLGTQNAFVVSYINSINNYLIDRTTLDKTIISKTLTGTDLNYTLNLNAFSQSLGFTTSKKFRATIFGSEINWATKTIDVTNNTLTIEFSIGKSSNVFETLVQTFTIDIFVEYTPYSLAFQLSKIIKSQLTANINFAYDQAFDPVVYDSISNLFYIQFNLNGTFAVQPTTLSGANYMELPNTVSPHVVISDETIANAGSISITDNTKLTLRVTDNVNNIQVVNGTFSDAFPNVSGGSGVLRISAPATQVLSAQTGAVTDDLIADIQVNDKIQFESPWFPKTIFAESSTVYPKDMTADGVVQVSIFGDRMLISSNAGQSWSTMGPVINQLSDIRISSDGERLTASTAFSTTYVGTNFGATWAASNHVTGANTVAISATGQYQLLAKTFNQIWISTDFGVNWVLATTQPPNNIWIKASMSDSGQYQLLTAQNNVWVSSNFGVDWFIATLPSIMSSGQSSAVSGNGQYQCVTGAFGIIYNSIDFGATWFAPTTKPNYASYTSLYVDISSDGSAQTVSLNGAPNAFPRWISTDFGVNWVERGTDYGLNNILVADDGVFQVSSGFGIIVRSYDSGNTWSTGIDDRNWRSVAVSDNGTLQSAVINNGQIYISKDSGNTWSPRDTNRNWQFISMSADGVKQSAVVFDGNIYVSADSGETWFPKDSNRGWVAVVMSADGVLQTAIDNTNGNIYVSTDSGDTWLAKGINANWQAVSMSADGLIRTACINSGQIYRSTDSGNTWVLAATQPVASAWNSLNMSNNGTIQTAGVDGGQIYRSTDSGDTWVLASTQPAGLSWQSISMSNDGTTQMIVADSEKIYKSTDSGDTWVEVFVWLYWRSISVSSTAQYQTAVANNNNVYISDDTGTTWTAVQSSRAWKSIDTSSDNVVQAAVVTNGKIYISRDSGITWNSKENNRNWSWISVSSTGQYQTAVVDVGLIYVSLDYGDTWASKDTSREWKSVSMSADGIYQTAVAQNSNIYITTDFWDTSTGKNVSQNRLSAIDVSSTGQYQTAGAAIGNGQFYRSTNFGVNWSAVGGIGKDSRAGIALSASGQIQIAAEDDTVDMSLDFGATWNVAFTAPYIVGNVAISSSGVIQGMIVVDGFIYISTDTGNSWVQRESERNWQSISISSDGKQMSAVVADGYVYLSTDTGKTWNPIYMVPQSIETNNWNGIALSSDGVVQSAIVQNKQINISIDSGESWTPVFSRRSWMSIAISSDGLLQTAVATNDKIYISTDTGSTWIEAPTQPVASNWQSVDISADGSIQTAVINPGLIYRSTDSGDTWALATTQPIASTWSYVAISSDGSIQTAVINPGLIYRSTDSGDTWALATTQPTASSWSSVSLSSDGVKQTAVVKGGQIYISSDSGDTWELATTQPAASSWNSVSMSGDALYQIAVAAGSAIYVSSDSGVTWVAKESARNWSHVSMAANGLIQSAVVDGGKIYTHPFLVDRDIVLNTQSVTSASATQDVAFFKESVASDATLASLNNFNMADGLNYNITSITTSNQVDIFVPPSNYTPDTLVAAINAEIVALNPAFTNAFSYDSTTNKISFTSRYGGNVITSTNLLNQMGFVPLPATINKDEVVVARAIVNPDLSGPTNIFIKSVVLGDLRKNFTGFSDNQKLKNVIAPLIYDNNSDSYQVIVPVHLFFSQKSDISIVDIQIVDEEGNIVNFNMDQNNVEVAFYFYES